jgi:AcrR family transcriptional regulator
MRRRAEYLGPLRRREPILDAAEQVFAEGGFAAASMASIAKAAGVAKPVLYDAFPGGKQELYFALLDRGQAAFLAHLDGVFASAQGKPLDEGLRVGMKGFLEYAELAPDAFRVIFGAAGTANPEVVRRTETVREGVIARMTDRTTELLGLPAEIRAAAEVYVRAIVAVSEELARWTARQPDLPRDALVDLLVLWFMRGFDGVLGGG